MLNGERTKIETETLDLEIIDYSKEVSAEVQQAIERGLEACAIQAEGHAKDILKSGLTKNVGNWETTGRLLNSIKGEVFDGDTLVVGARVDYAIYHEVGTGIYAEDGNGRQTPWFFKGKDGSMVMTRGVKPKHYIRDSLQNNVKEYKEIIENSLDKVK